MTPLGPGVAPEVVWREVRSQLRNFVARRIPPTDVDDVLQDVLLRAHESLGGLRRPDRLDAWLFQITRNTITDYYRARASSREVHDEAVDAAAPDLTPESDEAREATDLATCLEPMIAALPSRYREAIALVELEGLSRKEAAARAGLSSSGMKTRVQRARSRLRSMLLHCCQVEFDRRGGVLGYERRAGAACSCPAPHVEVQIRRAGGA